MEKREMEEIALIFLKERIRRGDYGESPFEGLGRRLGNVAKNTNIPLEKLKEFTRVIFNEVLDESLNPTEKAK